MLIIPEDVTLSYTELTTVTASQAHRQEFSAIEVHELIAKLPAEVFVSASTVCKITAPVGAADSSWMIPVSVRY